MPASDPNWLDEVKKRRRSLMRDAANTGGGGGRDMTPEQQRTALLDARWPAASISASYRVLNEQGASGYGQAISEGFERDFSRESPAMAELQRQMEYAQYGAAGAPANNTPLTSTLDPTVVTPGADVVQQDNDRILADQYRANPGSGGLTRIVKNPDGSYTNMGSHEQAGAEVRYYNQYGNREGVDPIAPLNQQSATAQNLETDDAAMLAAVRGTNGEGGGLRSREFARQGALQRTANEEQAALDAMPPAQRALLMSTQMQEGGRNRRGAEDRLSREAIAGGVAQTAAQKAEAEALKLLMEENKYTDAQFQDPKTAGSALRTSLGRLRNLSPEAQIRALSDPDNPGAGLALQAMEAQLGQMTGDPNVSLGQINETGGLRRTLTGQRFKTGGAFSPGFDPSEYGISDKDMDFMRELFLNVQANQRSSGR